MSASRSSQAWLKWHAWTPRQVRLFSWPVLLRQLTFTSLNQLATRMHVLARKMHHKRARRAQPMQRWFDDDDDDWRSWRDTSPGAQQTFRSRVASKTPRSRLSHKDNFIINLGRSMLIEKRARNDINIYIFVRVLTGSKDIAVLTRAAKITKHISRK